MRRRHQRLSGLGAPFDRTGSRSPTTVAQRLRTPTSPLSSASRSITNAASHAPRNPLHHDRPAPGGQPHFHSLAAPPPCGWPSPTIHGSVATRCDEALPTAAVGGEARVAQRGSASFNRYGAGRKPRPIAQRRIYQDVRDSPLAHRQGLMLLTDGAPPAAKRSAGPERSRRIGFAAARNLWSRRLRGPQTGRCGEGVRGGGPVARKRRRAPRMHCPSNWLAGMPPARTSPARREKTPDRRGRRGAARAEPSRHRRRQSRGG